MFVIHLVEGMTKRPREGEIVRTKCDQEFAFRPFGTSLGLRAPICAECEKETHGVTRIPNFLAVSAPLSKHVGA